MFLKKLLFPACLLGALGTMAQGGGTPVVPQVSFYIKLHDTVRHFTVTDPAGMPPVFPPPAFSVSFGNTALDSVLASYNVGSFEQSYPNSNLLYLRQFYTVTCDSLTNHLGQVLVSNFPGYFTSYENMPEGKLLSTPYFPIDYHTSGTFNSKFLEYIDAPVAWGVNRGNPDVLIGISDTYFDLGHPDLANKVEEVFQNNPTSASYAGHGTTVAGFAGAETDEAVNSYPSMGFNCRMVLTNRWANDDEMHRLGFRNGVRVINGSWINQLPTTDYNHVKKGNVNIRMVYDEIYENGVVSVIAAGNGRAHHGIVSSDFLFPASYDHNISVSSVGWGDGRTDVNVADIHEVLPGEPDIKCHQHNLRVDILAPGYDLGGLTYDPNDANRKYEHFDPGVTGNTGTSFAAPIVAGTVGLMFSQSPCLSPYQVEWVLKQTAKNIYGEPDNMKYDNGPNRYSGSLGAGKLEAGKALRVLDPLDEELYEGDVCNDAALQTFIIEGIELNTRCAPGSASNSVKPRLKPVLRNGTPPYTYQWVAAGTENHTTLDDYDIAEPTIMTATADKVAYYYLTVRDGSEIQKVASRLIKIQLTDAAAYDLAMRDSYMDMLDEPNAQYTHNNTDWNIWKSPDLWVRNSTIPGNSTFVHEDPVYASGIPVYVYTRVRNMGCIVSPAENNEAQLHLYWTKASTGEQWPDDWTGLTDLPVSGGGTLPAGGFIGTLNIPALQPGEEYVDYTPWQPTDPAIWTIVRPSENPDVCLLARITHGGANDGMRFAEVQNTTTNVRNNNNSVTRNLSVKTLSPVYPSHFVKMLLANADNTAKLFKIQLVPDKLVQKHLSGDYAKLATLTLEFDPADMPLFDALSNGFEGSLDVDYTGSTVTYDGSSLIEFEHVPLDKLQKIPLGIRFDLKSGLDEYPEMPFEFHLRQFEETLIPGPGGGGGLGGGIGGGYSIAYELYGNVSFLVNVQDDTAQARPASVEESTAKITLSGLNIYPNPAHNSLYVHSKAGNLAYDKVQIVDIYGRSIKEISNFRIEGKPREIQLSDMAPGTYFISFYAQGKAVERLRFVKL